jgi:hypothetical protein
MPKSGRHKKYTRQNLPTKMCPVCGLDFAWRKRWEKIWNEVRYCSERCRRKKSAGGGGTKKTGAESGAGAA